MKTKVNKQQFQTSKRILRRGVATLLIVCLSACSYIPFLAEAEDDNTNMVAMLALALASGGGVLGEEYSGGATTRFDSTVNAFDLPAANIGSTSRLIEFLDGNTIFNRNWVTAPAAAFDGLGPVFNNTSCRGCHARDGRGRPPLPSESSVTTMLFRLSDNGQDPTTGGPKALTNYGTQLQDKAITGVIAEGSVNLPIAYTETPGTFPDGEAYSLRVPTYTFNWNYGTPAAVNVSPRTAPQMYGLGLLMAISEASILANVDENDADGDGVSGRANYVWEAATSSTKLGRLGWKANNPGLSQQNQGAFLGDMGITSSLFSNENCAGAQTNCAAAASGNQPNAFEVSLNNSNLTETYTNLIAVPGRRNWKDADVVQGKTYFVQVGCAKCHIPQFQTGVKPGFPEVSNQTIYPYTDLLLHDMGADLADNRTDFLATGQEWRTPPLWGTGLIETVNGHNNLLHDGRARGFKEAILWHGGEGANARTAFMNLNKAQREQLIKFLESL